MSLHPQVVSVLAAGRTEALDLEAERAAYRRVAEELGGPVEEVARVADLTIGGRLPARAYWPLASAATLGVVVWLHGGGWYMGDVEGFDRVTRQLANAAGAVCLSVDYRLAPEHPYPAGVHDARAAVAWAASEGAAQLGAVPGHVVVGGDSAGGNLAAVAAPHERESLRAQMLVYPALDPAMAGDSYRERVVSVTIDDMAACWQTYLGGADPGDPDVSPLLATDLDGAPPAYIAVAGHDIMRDDGLRYAEALRAAGVTVRLDRYDDMTHSFLRWGGAVDRAHELIAALGAYARAAIAG